MSTGWTRDEIAKFIVNPPPPQYIIRDVFIYLKQVVETTSTHLLLSFLAFSVFAAAVLLYLVIFITAPYPRKPFPAEKQFVFLDKNGNPGGPTKLPCWHDKYIAELEVARKRAATLAKANGTPVKEKRVELEKAELFFSLVIPAFNEEARLERMLREAVVYLYTKFPFGEGKEKTIENGKGSAKGEDDMKGWEVLIVSDGSTDSTVQVALRFSKTLAPNLRPHIRIVPLLHNRGKGGAVTHGLRHVRGQYALFADADGATRFNGLGDLLSSCEALVAADPYRRGVAVGSRAHLVGSDAVVKRSKLRNLLMHSFHLFLRIMTPPATARIKDTQCGFKLFSREALADIVPNMHSEGWIFDVEMLMLAEQAGIKVAEVPVEWSEVKGSKLDVLRDSLGMAWGLAVLRVAWSMGVYRRL